LDILLVQNNDDQRDTFSLFLDNLPFAVTVFETVSVDRAEEVLKKGKEFDLVVVGHVTGLLDGSYLYAELKKIAPNTAVIINSDEKLEIDDVNCRQIPYLSNGKTLSEQALELIKDVKDLDFNYEVEDYKKVKLIYFLRFNKVLCDIYVRLSKDKYIKIISKGDVYTREDLDKYKSKRITHLHILSSDYQEFSSNFASTPFLIEDKTLVGDEVENAIVSTLEIIHELVTNVGITQQVLNLVDYSIYQIDEQLKDDKLILKLLTKMRDKKDYLIDHSYLLAYISNSICQEMEWDKEETRIKLFYASLLHDITVKNSDLAMAVDLQLASLVDFNEDEINDYKKHPLQIAELIKKSNNIPLNVDELVENHHEKPEQTGFPKGLGPSRVSLLSGIFNVAHAFVNELYRNDFDQDELPRIFKLLSKRFTTGNYKTPFEGLVKAFKGKGLNI